MEKATETHVEVLNSRAKSLLMIVDIVGVPSFLAWYIWHGHRIAQYSLLVVFIWAIASFVFRGDTLRTLGIRADNLTPATYRALPVFAVFSLLPIVAGLSMQSFRQVPAIVKTFDFGLYFTFCLLQQIFLNSLLNNRVLSMIGHRGIASLLVGAIFAALHWPNIFIVGLTFLGGTAMAYLFARERNILPLAVGQTWFVFLLFWATPPSWHHYLFVGPAYYHLPF
jgi:hypothetical protein